MTGGPCRGYHCVGQAVFRNIVNQTGWALLELETFPAFSDTVQVSQYCLSGRGKSFNMTLGQSSGLPGGLGDPGPGEDAVS